jgi:predicted transcriptional regulator
LTVAEAVAATGRGFKEVERQLLEMARAGYIEADSDEQGQVFYVFPGLGR